MLKPGTTTSTNKTPGPQHHEDEDQPHMVGFPHRADRMVDHLTGCLAPFGPAGHEIPEAGAEVGAAEWGRITDSEPLRKTVGRHPDWMKAVPVVGGVSGLPFTAGAVEDVADWQQPASSPVRTPSQMC